MIRVTNYKHRKEWWNTRLAALLKKAFHLQSWIAEDQSINWAEWSEEWLITHLSALNGSIQRRRHSKKENPPFKTTKMFWMQLKFKVYVYLKPLFPYSWNNVSRIRTLACFFIDVCALMENFTLCICFCNHCHRGTMWWEIHCHWNNEYSCNEVICSSDNSLKGTFSLSMGFYWVVRI